MCTFIQRTLMYSVLERKRFMSIIELSSMFRHWLQGDVYKPIVFFFELLHNIQIIVLF